jgi:hypothetical protein
MIVCLAWFSLMAREGEIGMKSSALGDSRGAEHFLYPLYIDCWSYAEDCGLNLRSRSRYRLVIVALATA